MSNWDLMMPGMGLTAIGLAGVVISYSGLAHTFIDGMHALTGLTMILGLIFLATGILDGGVSTSNRAKATMLVVISIVLAFGMAGFLFNTISTTGIFAGVLIAITFPAVIMAYVATKVPQYTKSLGAIFAMAAAAGIISYMAFGLVGPDTYLIPEEIPEPEVEPEPEPFTGEIVPVSILEGSDIQGNPDYLPDVLVVTTGSGIEWINEDIVAHTVTSMDDVGETFDSGLINMGETYFLDTSLMVIGDYNYFCIVHPWMQSILTVQDIGADTTPEAAETPETPDMSETPETPETPEAEG